MNEHAHERASTHHKDEPIPLEVLPVHCGKQDPKDEPKEPE